MGWIRLRCRRRWSDEEIDGLKNVDDRWSMVGMQWERQRIGKARASWKGMGKDIAMPSSVVWWRDRWSDEGRWSMVNGGKGREFGKRRALSKPSWKGMRNDFFFNFLILCFLVFYFLFFIFLLSLSLSLKLFFCPQLWNISLVVQGQFTPTHKSPQLPLPNGLTNWREYKRRITKSNTTREGLV